MQNSVNTNNGALVALQSLNRTNTDLERVQKRVTTGYRVNDAVDDGAIFAVAQSIRGDIGAIDAVNSQLTVAQGAVTVFSTAATNISNSLTKARQVLVKLADANLNSDQRSKYDSDFQAIRGEITNFISNSAFNKRNLLNGSYSQLTVIANADGTQYTIVGTSITGAIAAAFTAVASASSAASLLSGDFSAAERRVGDVMNSFGADLRRLKNQAEFNRTIQDALTTSLGAIVDADLAKESANLQALQIKQQLGAQTLGIANQAPQVLAALFR